MGKASNDIPTLRYGNKIYPEDIAGMIGLPSVGNIWYVDPGKSVSGGGTTKADAFITVAEALSAATADNDDVVVIAASSATGRTVETAIIDWSKRRTHLIGNGVARQMTPRNGVGVAASASSGFTVSANQCIFQNLTFAAFSDTDVCVEVTGEYNTFNGVHFQGIAHATPAGETGARSLLLTGAGENEFNGCTIGLDTVTRTVANASLELTGSCPRNIFRGCLFPVYTSSADALWVKADTGNCYERFLIFEDCLFTNASLGSSTVMTIGMDLSTTGNGQIYSINSRFYGATDLAATASVTNLIQANTVFDTNDQGLMTVHANS